MKIKTINIFFTDENVCALGQFRCSNGQCISERLKCNAIKDCLDGSDELSDDCLGKFFNLSKFLLSNF